MTNEKKNAAKAVLMKIGKAVWSALPWIFLWIAATCWFLLPFLYADEEAKLTNQISALEAENTRYESERAHLTDEIKWLRSLLEEDGDGQTQ
jgi:cell division protein FtsB